MKEKNDFMLKTSDQNSIGEQQPLNEPKSIN